MIFQLDIPIYNTNVLFVISPSREEMDEFLSVEKNRCKLTDEEFHSMFRELDDEKFGGYTTSLDKGGYLVLLKYEHDNPYYYIHELYHLANLILFDREIEHTRTDEPYAYLLSWIVGQYLKYINTEEQLDNKKQ